MTGFPSAFGAEPEGVWAAPGRVNLIGEHTDYNEGLVLPIALSQTVRAAARRRDDGRIRLRSAQQDSRVVDLTAGDLRPGGITGWAAYPAGVVWALVEAGHLVGGADLHFDSDVPAGAGLSSSAALECATAAVYNDLYDLGLTPEGLASIAHRAENAFVGVPCGVMDQTASACSAAGTALLLDTRSMARRHVPFDPTAHGLDLLVLDTRVRHDLTDGAYAELRAGCEHAAELLGLRALRDLTTDDITTDITTTGDPAVDGRRSVLSRLPAALQPLVRHVVTENERVIEAVAILEEGVLPRLGPILTAGHASLRDDLRISCPETDLAVATAVEAGALGARMTGGGFGGSVIALVPAHRTAAVTEAVTAAFRAARHRAPFAFTAATSAGAHRIR
ncbi:galactokinase [Parafrankia elaeagni]|uniref:galactokinase n=1 Tax=Parafrankia elaeagni TaxID=222534 RepID=UPI000378BA3D|nr:galactokinase [Parafrankia elaeagni]